MRPKEKLELTLEAASFRPDASRKIVAVSHRVKEETIRHYGVPADKIVVIHNGIDANDFNLSLGTPGLTGIAFWPLDGDYGSLTAAGDAPFVDGHSGQAVHLNGGFLDAGKPVLNTASDYSVAAWVKLDKADGAFQTVISQDGATVSDFFLQYSGADQRFAMSFAGIRALGPSKPEVGRWYHLVGVRDTVRGELRLYVDGELAGTAGACLPQSAPTGNTVIGRGKYNGNPVDYLDGTVDQVHLYDRALSATEIRDLYASNQ
jgi:glycosyltransferase involved in cell wall biosynthesis